MIISFNDSESHTIGIELELQLVDRANLGLVSRSSEIIDSLGGLDGFVKHELMMSNIEVISKVCSGVGEAEADLKEKVSTVVDAASSFDTLISPGSTHPFSRWRDQEITEDERYQRLFNNLQMVARRFNIFGLHVHVGVRGGERCVYIMNRMLYYLPHLLALSANSPFWEGLNSGLSSYRTKVFETLPIAGLPFYFHDWSDYTTLVKNYLATGTIETIRELWWDIRPHPDFGTIEVRICDIPPTISETLAIASLIQAMVKRFSEDFDKGVPFKRPHSAITRENKWRACRFGLGAEFITKEGNSTRGAVDVIGGMVKDLEAEARELGSLEYLKGVEKILGEGESARRQLRTWQETGDFKEVVRSLARGLAEEVASEKGR